MKENENETNGYRRKMATCYSNKGKNIYELDTNPIRACPCYSIPPGCNTAKCHHFIMKLMMLFCCCCGDAFAIDNISISIKTEEGE